MGILYSALKESGSGRKRIIDYLNQPRHYDWSHGGLYLDEYGEAIMETYYVFVIYQDESRLKTKFIIEDFPDER